jgi:DnaJ-class molecular chaperone
MNALLPHKCPTCDGTGMVVKPNQGEKPPFLATVLPGKVRWTCRTCGGGKMIWTEDPHEATT